MTHRNVKGICPCKAFSKIENSHLTIGSEAGVQSLNPNDAGGLRSEGDRVIRASVPVPSLLRGIAKRVFFLGDGSHVRITLKAT